MTLAKHMDRDLLQALPAEARVKLLQTQLRIDPEQLRKIAKGALLVLCVPGSLIGQRPQSLCSLALTGDALREFAILIEQRCTRVPGSGSRVAHEATVWEAPDAQAILAFRASGQGPLPAIRIAARPWLPECAEGVSVTRGRS